MRVDAGTGAEAVRFETDSDRHAWRDYASAALRGLMREAADHEAPMAARAMEAEQAAEQAARAADAMLRLEQARRKARRPGRRG